MYHLELRKFPHTVCRFNQSERDVLAIVLPWVKDEWIEQGERKWNPQDASITVLEGPELSMSELAMGRGWRNAERRSQDVTSRVLEAAREVAARQSREAQGTSAPTPTGTGPGVEADLPPQGTQDLLADSLGLELLALLDDGVLAPARVWEVARIRLESGSAADSLALAERAVRSLLGRGLVVVRRSAEEGLGEGGPDPELTAEEVERALAAAETWSGHESTPGALVIARKV
ncbi:MAG TPA: hypothetical protein VMB05_01705 [Solirubrobacteraceae bacterium]|nr:hypothetical protein [Solirubrobacteraceae bacterium]